jgi:asparagine synthase (glutamine-hydrolysing)
LFLDSVRLHLRSDVPVGTALSGGVDSSSIVMAVREVAGRQSDFHTFSFVASGSADDEEQWVDIVTAAAGTTAHKVQIAAAELVHDLDDLIIVQDEPFVSTSIYAQYQVFRLAHRHGIKVLLDGQGADEMLAGYRGYLISRLWTLLRQSRLREAFAFGRRAAKQPGVGLRCLLRATCGQGLPNWLFAAVKPLVSKERWLDQRWFARRGVDIITHGAPPSCSSLRANLVDTFSSSILPSLLRYEDRNSMAFSIESRVPFLTPRIAEFLFSLPEAYLIDGDGTSKHVFRAAMRGIVPDAILDRRDKIGFATPELRWLRTIRPWVDHVLNSEAARAIPVLRPQVVIDQWNAMYWGSQKFDWRVWRSLNLIRWSEHLGIQF